MDSRLPALAPLVLALLACAAPIDRSDLDTERPVVERSAPDTLVIQWRAAPPGASLPVYAGVAPDAIEHARPVATFAGGHARISGLDPGTRYYFELFAPGGAPVRVAERRLPLEGAHNFRDLGGYPTTDGRSVRWGRVFRSDALGELTEDDVGYLSRLGLRLVCDFRSPQEREAAPDRLPAGDPPELLSLPIYDPSFDPALLRQKILSGDLAELDLSQLLIDGNRSFVSGFSEQFASLFERLADGSLPAVMHCTAGKDRAGFASAMLLLALGVDRETVLEDFLLTNVYTAAQIESTLRRIRLFSWFRTDPEQVRPLLGVRREYLEAAFGEIDARYGTLERYLEQGLGLDPQRRERLQAQLLE